MRYTKQQIKRAMIGTGGIVSQILANLKKSTKDVGGKDYPRQALYKRISKNPELKQAYLDEQERIGDIAETSFLLALQDKEQWAIREWFRYKGWTRGYVAKQDTSITGDLNVALVEFIGKGKKLDDNQDQNTDTS